jgi:hypothetical protein
MRPAHDMSIPELLKIIASKKAKLVPLLKKRDQLIREIEATESHIAELQARLIPVSRPRSTKPRLQNAMPLRQVVQEVLKRSRKGLPLANLHDRVLASGYKTGSKNFKNILYQCLYNEKEFVHDPTTGRYRLVRR